MALTVGEKGVALIVSENLSLKLPLCTRLFGILANCRRVPYTPSAFILTFFAFGLIFDQIMLANLPGCLRLILLNQMSLDLSQDVQIDIRRNRKI